MQVELSSRPVPPRALAISVGALIVPVVGALEVPEALGDYGALSWLLALVPAFLLAYYRAWKGVATALATGMATLSLTQAVVLWLGRPVPHILPGVVVAYLALALGIGWLADSLHEERAAVEDMAFTDLLTRLPNRRHARVFLENEFAAAERGRLLSVVLFDLDRFKSYNDKWGHAAGDEALRAFADILEPSTRRMDLSARFGGEEFLSVLTSTDTEGALIFADRIRSRLAATDLSSGDRLTVSAGVATFQPNIRSPDEMLGAADEALYRAKRQGRNRVRLFGRKTPRHATRPAPAPRRAPEVQGAEPSDYPRASEEIGRSRPSERLLPEVGAGLGSGRRAMVVEHDGHSRSLVSGYLTQEGFHVAQASDASGGIEMLGQEFDIVISDLGLPGVPGTELVAAVKTRWPATQIIVTTARPDDRSASEALRSGADRHLSGPFGATDLRPHLVELLARRDDVLRARVDGGPPTMDRRSEGTQEQDSLVGAMHALADATELHDPYTHGHGVRVAAYAERLAKDLDDETLPEGPALRLACELHDLGKIGVSHAILNKEGRLGPGEVEQMREHPMVGRRILASITDDEDVLAAATWHHEWWDGSGYPDGLKGEAIPLMARLVAVCDVLDAMTCERPHRLAYGWEQAIEVIRAQSGHQFDPAVVKAMDSCLDDLRLVFEGLGPEMGAEPD